MEEKTHSGMVLDEHNEVTIEELIQVCCCDVDWIIELVGEGILDPIGKDVKQWRFTGVSLLTTRTAMHLQRDLGINLPGIALALDLMQEVQQLQGLVNRTARSD